MTKTFYPNIFTQKSRPFLNALFIAVFFLNNFHDLRAQRISSFVFNNLPQNYQLYPRDAQNMANVPLSGIVEAQGYSYISVQVFRNDNLVNYAKADIKYDNKGIGSFSTETKIKAELAEYSFKVFACKASDSTLVITRKNVVSGDVYILAGQSNSTGFFAEPDTSEFCRTFGKITGNLNTETYNAADTLWTLSNHDFVTQVGTMGFEIQKQLAEKSGIPNCLINGGTHWSSAATFALRNENNPADLNNPYGRILYRAQKAGVANDVKAFIFRQGETEAYNEGSDWEGNFKKLRENLKTDLSKLQMLYVYQIDIIYYPTLYAPFLRDYQRRLSEIYPDVKSLATVGTEQFDGLHYGREGYKQNGLELSRLMERDLYQLKDTSNIDSPNIRKALYTDAARKQLTLIFDEGQELLYPDLYKPNGNVTLNLKDFFYLDGLISGVLSGKAQNNRIILELTQPHSATLLGYLPPYLVEGGSYYPYDGPFIKNKLGMRAFTFYNVPISVALETPALTASIQQTGSLLVKWNNITGATEYVLERKANEETNYQTIAVQPASLNEFEDKTAKGGQKLFYRLRSSSKTSESIDYGYVEIELPLILSVPVENDNLFSVFPNPALKSENVTIRFNEPLTGTVELINSLGQVVIESENIKQQSQINWNISKLNSEEYFIKLKSNGKEWTKKIMLY